tara:strand:+ start:1061 stop:1243 length:183 start_codon:yes stop_codon:yes gene_type:complete
VSHSADWSHQFVLTWSPSISISQVVTIASDAAQMPPVTPLSASLHPAAVPEHSAQQQPIK